MNDYTKAQFWKCALQVNPAGYIAYRGTDHGMTKEEYNQELLNIAKENDIKVLGLADHGNVTGVKAIQNLMAEHGIIVFPGFEISSSEKVHFVCLFQLACPRFLFLNVVKFFKTISLCALALQAL